MKLIIAVISQKKEKIIQKALVKENIQITCLTSSGAFFKTHNETFLIGVEDEEVEKVINIIKKKSKTEMVKHGDTSYEFHDSIVFVCPLVDRKKY